MNQEPSNTPVPPSETLQPKIEIVEVPNYKPVMTYSILGVTVFVWLLQMATLYLIHIPGLPAHVDIPAALGLKDNAAILAGQYWRLFTPMLLHDDLLPLHILTNMYFLVVVGAQLERFAGHRRFLLLYIAAGFAGNVMSFLFSPDNSLGASTALFGLMGAQLIFVLQNRSFLAGNGRAALQNILILIGLNLFIGFALGFIDNWGHIGGLVGGLAFGWFGGVKLAPQEVAYPRFRLADTRGLSEEILGALLVFIVFGGFAVLKILGIAF